MIYICVICCFITVNYVLQLLRIAVFIVCKLTVSPLLSTAQGPTPQSIDSETNGDASSRYFQQVCIPQGGSFSALLTASLRNCDPVGSMQKTT
jgi:hypothetical protein